MPVRQLQRVVQTACKAAQAFAVEDLTDGKLLAQFLAQKDGPAFAELVRRHGPMVIGVCRRVIGNHHDAEDAFQATFLVLARKAASLATYEQLAGWVHEVAYRTAQEVRGRLARQQSREAPLSEFPDHRDDTCMQNEIKAIVDREVSRLPDKYRLPVVLCELEGRSRFEAARMLSVAEGTLSSRLASARKTLARRLSKYGFTVPATGLLVFMEQQSAACGVPERLAESVVSSAVHSVSGRTAFAMIPASVQSLADSVMRAMSFGRAKAIVALVLVAGMIATGVVIGNTPAAKVASGAVPNVTADAKDSAQSDVAIDQVRNPELSRPEVNLPITGRVGQESSELKTKLKQMEADILRLRQAMLKECEAEEKKFDDAARKAKNEMDEALRRKDFDGQRKALQAMTKAGSDKMLVHRMRMDIETRMRMDDPHLEQRFGLSMSNGAENAIGKLLNGAKDRGLMIERVAKDSPAAKAGIQPLDILVEIDARPVPSGLPDFRKMLAEMQPESAVDVTLIRKGRKQTIKGLVVPGATD